MFGDCSVLRGVIARLVQALWDQQLGLLCLWPWQQQPREGWETPFSRGGRWL